MSTTDSRGCRVFVPVNTIKTLQPEEGRLDVSLPVRDIISLLEGAIETPNLHRSLKS